VPRRGTLDVARRKAAVLRYLNEAGGATVSEIARALSLTPMEAYYALAQLTKEGKVMRINIGRIHVYIPMEKT